MTPTEWTILAVYFAGPSGLSPVQLQKSLFLVAEGIHPDTDPPFYRFVPYNYGPFCKAVYVDAEELAAQGCISIEASPGQRWNRFVITRQGARQAERLIDQAPRKATDYLRSVVEWACRLSFASLVRAIYDRYPAYRANSVFQG